MKSVCPTCSRPYPPRLKVNGPVRQRVVEIVANRPDGIPIRELCNLTYADDPNGGPLTAQRSINVIVHRANDQLRQQGYQIRARWRGRGSFYELIKINARKNGKSPRTLGDKLSNSINELWGKSSMTTSKAEEQAERARVMLEDLRKQQGATLHGRAQADAEVPQGRYAAINKTQIVGANALPIYPAAAAHQSDPCGPEPALGYRIDAMPELESPIVASSFGEAQAPGPASDDAPSLASLGDAPRADDAGPPLSDEGADDAA
jgi:hypothetical protein